MTAYLIDPDAQTVTEHSYDGQPNALYTLFGSLLVEAHAVLHAHSVYSAAEAFEKGERGFLLGEKLLFGRVLVTGNSGYADTDAAISAAELEAITAFALPEFYKDALALLPDGFRFDERFEMPMGEGVETVTAEWVFYAFNMADNATKSYFLTHLEQTVAESDDVYRYLKKMGESAIRSLQ